MSQGLKWSFFGSSLVTAYWNSSAIYYRGIIQALALKGHKITFYEPDFYDRQKNRDINDPEWAKIHIYNATQEGLDSALEEAFHADIIVKSSGIGIFDERLETSVAQLKKPHQLLIFWDIDPLSTLTQLNQNSNSAFLNFISQTDLIFTLVGGKTLIEQYQSLSKKQCVPIYNALNRFLHFRVKPEPRFTGTLGFLGNRLQDREKQVDDLFMSTVEKMPKDQFLLGGNGWGDKRLPDNMRYLGHVFLQEHNAFNSSVKAVLSLSKNKSIAHGFSPSARIFEAAGAGACLISDEWEGIDSFLDPGKEVLVVRNGDDLIDTLKSLTEKKTKTMGEAALKRVSSQHTYEHRAEQIESAI